MTSRVMPGGKQQITSAELPTQDFFVATLTSCSEKFLLASEIEWSHCSNLTVSFLHSEPENHGIPGILLRNVIPDTPGKAGPVLVPATDTRNGLSSYFIESHVE